MLKCNKKIFLNTFKKFKLCFTQKPSTSFVPSDLEGDVGFC